MQLSLQASGEPRSRHLPVELYGALRHVEDLRDLACLQIRKEAQLGDSPLALVELAQCLELLVQGEHVDGFVAIGERAQRDVLFAAVAAAFGRFLVASMVDQHLAHGSRRDIAEVSAVAPSTASGARHLQVGLVQEGGRLQRVLRAPAAEDAPGDLVQLIIKQAKELFGIVSHGVQSVRVEFWRNLENLSAKHGHGDVYTTEEFAIRDQWVQRIESCFDDCARRAWRLAYAYLRDAGDAYDVVQQAFVVAASKPDQIPESETWPWFSAVVLNEARNARRKKRPTTGALDEERLTALVDKQAGDPSDPLLRQETQDEIWRALETLPLDEREAVVLTHLCELTHEQAARSMAVPRQTLTARVGRGLQRLRAQLRGGEKPSGERPGDAALASRLAVLPIVAPPGGWEQALGLWRGEALGALEGVVAGTGVTSGVVQASWVAGGAVMNKVVLVVSMAVVLGVGLAGGAYFASSSVDSEARREEKLAQRTAAEETEAAARSELAEAARRTRTAQQARVAALQEENRTLRERLAQVEAQQEAASEDVAVPGAGPLFTFGAAGQLPGVLDANWAEMAAADLIVNAAVLEVYENTLEGVETPKETYLRLQENVERMRKYEYRTIGAMPTDARHNGELTHPISVANLLAAQLTQLGQPLSDEQISAITQLGLDFEAAFARQREAYPDGTLKVVRLLDEYVIKGQFVDDLQELLAPAQRDLLIDPRSHRIAFLDLHCPSLMIIHSSPIILERSPEKIRAKAQEHIVSHYELSEEQTAAIAPALDTWLSRVSDLIARPVARHDVRYYSYDDSVIAGEATVELLTQLLRTLPKDSESRTKVLAEDGFIIPRLLEEEDANS